MIISTKIVNKNPPQKLTKKRKNQRGTEILFGNIFCLFHNSPVNVKISFPFCVFGNKNVSVFARSMCITQRKIVSNYCFRQCSNKYFFTNYSGFWWHLLISGIIEIFHLKIQRKICEICEIVRVKMAIFH